jgi:hypothetical protein
MIDSTYTLDFDMNQRIIGFEMKEQAVSDLLILSYFADD